MSVQATERFAAHLERIADDATVTLTRLWDWVSDRPDAEDVWILTARPILRGAASAAVDLSAGFAVAVEGTAGTASDLIVPTAVSHVWDPIEVTHQALGGGHDWTAATRRAADTVDALASDTVMASGRQAAGERLTTRTTWTRRVNIGACRWCLNLSSTEWPSAAAATFGHARCRCIAIPSAFIGDWNDRQRAVQDHRDRQKETYEVRDQITRLRRSERHAMERSRAAARELAAERDPARRERLSMREQDWETRAERAAERRRLLETGSHRLAD